MLPSCVERHDKLWKDATDVVAAVYEKRELKGVPTEIFDYQVDKNVFKKIFDAVNQVHKLYVAPDWPWSLAEVLEAGAGDSIPSRAYDDYLRDQKTKSTEADKKSVQNPMESVTTSEKTAIPSPVVSSDTVEPADGPKNSVLHAAKPIFSVQTLRGEMERDRDLTESVEAVWKQYRGENAITGPIVAPFTLKLETFIPDMLVRASEIDRINQLLWCCEVVYQDDERLLSVQFIAGNGPSPQRSRVEYLKTWSTIESWLNDIYTMCPITLYEYFHYVQMIGITGHPEGPDELLANKTQIDENYEVAQETLARSIRIRGSVYSEVQNLITSDADETDRALSQWVLSRSADERLICARIAAWNWLNRCDISLMKKVEQWGSNAISQLTNQGADENGLE
ncbi:hypothetical protein ACHAPQ_000106 [Fusarium lateritium]